MEFNVFEIKVITVEVINYYKSNLDIAKRQYDDLINFAKPRGLNKKDLDGYFEAHHIVARCLGGNDSEDNLVLLTFKEHILAHLLLHTINPTIYGLTLAFKLLIGVKEKKDLNSDLYIDLSIIDSLKNDLLSDPNYKKRISDSIKKCWKDQGYRKQVLDIINTPTAIERRLKNLNTKEAREKKQATFNTKELKEKRSGITRELWKDSSYVDKIYNSVEIRFGIVGPDNSIYRSVNSASKLLKISRTTLQRWVNEGKNGWKRVEKS